jgi:flagellar basal-body rod protein FlgB
MTIGSLNFWETQDLLTKALDAYALRWQVVSDNIANADTPNFKRSDVSFESQLSRTMFNSDSPHIPTKMTNPRHISFHQAMNWQDVTPRINLDYSTEYRNDKNNVDIDREMVYAAKTQLEYSAVSSIISRNFRNLNNLMR